MTKCNDAVPLLGPLLDEALPADDAAWVQEHLAGCEKCRDRKALLAAQAQGLREVLEVRSAAVDFSGFSQRVMDRIAREPAPTAWQPAWFTELWGAHRTAFAAGGSALAAACLALAVWLAPQRGADEGIQLLADASAPQLDEVDFGSHDGAVMELGDRTPVIWLSDDRGVQQ